MHHKEWVMAPSSGFPNTEAAGCYQELAFLSLTNGWQQRDESRNDTYHSIWHSDDIWSSPPLGRKPKRDTQSTFGALVSVGEIWHPNKQQRSVVCLHQSMTFLSTLIWIQGSPPRLKSGHKTVASIRKTKNIQRFLLLGGFVCLLFLFSF